MGTWGSGLYANDTTCDVRDTYLNYLRDGLSNQESYEKTLLEMETCLDDEDEAPLFWYAMAETQWKVGRLMPDVRDKALEWIEKEGGLSLWLESSSKGTGWKKTLSKLKEKLNSPMPPEKKLRKPGDPKTNPWNINDLYAYQFPENTPLANKYVVLQKVCEEIHYGGRVVMRIQVYDKIFEQLPTLESLSSVRLIPLDGRDPSIYPEGFDYTKDLIMNRRIFPGSSRDYPGKRFTYIGNQPGPPNACLEKCAPCGMYWTNLSNDLHIYFQNWHGVECKDIGDGIYQYTGQ